MPISQYFRVMVWKKGLKLPFLVFIFSVAALLGGTVFWLSKSYAVEKQKVLTTVFMEMRIPDSLFTLPQLSSHQIDSALGVIAAGRAIRWQVRRAVMDKPLKQSALPATNKKMESFSMLLPNGTYAFISVYISPLEIFRSMWLSVALAFFLILLMGLSVWLVAKSFSHMQAHNRMKLDFFHNITHELKTPVSGIIATTELLRDFGYMDNLAKRNELLDRIRIEASRLNGLVEQIIDLSAMDEQALLLNTEPLDLFQLMEEVISSFQDKAQKRNATIHHLKMEGLPPVQGNKKYIENVCSVLLDNALKYGGHGVVITIEYGMNRKGICLSVKDNGAGVPFQFRSKLFQKFFRPPTRQSKEISGNGLGLHYARKVIELHQGTLNYVPEERGARFPNSFS